MPGVWTGDFHPADLLNGCTYLKSVLYHDHVCTDKSMGRGE